MQHPIVRTLLATTLAVAAWLPFTAHAQTPAREKVVLMLNWFAYGEHAPFFLGKARGYFEQEGIDIEFQEGRGSAVTIQAVGAGTADLGYADIGVMMKAVARGAPVKTVGVLLQSTPSAVISPADRNIRTAADLVGKTIAVTPGDALAPIFPLYLKMVGLNDRQFKTITGDAQMKMNSVVNKQADALLGFVTEQGARMPGIVKQPVNILRWSDAGVNLVGLGIVAKNDTLRTRGDMVRRFMRAATRSAEEAIKDPQAAVDAMMKARPDAGQPEAQLESLKLSQALYFTTETKGGRPFKVSPKVMDQTLDTLVQYGGLETGTKANDYYTLEFLP